MMDLYVNPELIHAVLEKGVAHSIERGKFQIDLGLRILRLNDSMANMNLISPAHWREFIFPYIKTICDELHCYCPEVKIYCHVCGNVLPIIDLLVKTGLDCIAPLDPLGKFTVVDARAAVGPNEVLMGGINTMSFIQASPAQIAAEVRRCLVEGSSGRSRFILGSGCVVPRTAPAELLQAVTHAARSFQYDT